MDDTPAAVVRTPVSDGPPHCFGMHGSVRTHECAACGARAACRRATERADTRLTAAEGARQAEERYRRLRLGDAQPHDLVALAARLWGEASGRRTDGWASDRAWLSTMDLVSRSCVAAGWDPRTYIRAQVELWGWFCREKGYAFRPACMVGEKANARFRRWAERNERRQGRADVDRRADPAREALLLAETVFGRAYFEQPDAHHRWVEAHVRADHPLWSLDVTRVMPHVRLPALAASLATLDPTAPHRFLLPPSGEVSWPRARRFALGWFAPVTGPVGSDVLDGLDPSLGEVVA